MRSENQKGAEDGQDQENHPPGGIQFEIPELLSSENGPVCDIPGYQCALGEKEQSESVTAVTQEAESTGSIRVRWS